MVIGTIVGFVVIGILLSIGITIIFILLNTRKLQKKAFKLVKGGMLDERRKTNEFIRKYPSISSDSGQELQGDIQSAVTGNDIGSDDGNEQIDGRSQRKVRKFRIRRRKG